MAAFAALLLLFSGAGVAAAQGIEDDERVRVAEQVSSDLSLDEDTVLLGLALDNAGDADVEVGDLLEGDVLVERATVVDRDVSLDEDTVFSALALDLALDDLLVDGSTVDLGAVDTEEELEDLEDLDLDSDLLTTGDGGLDTDTGGIDVGTTETVLLQRRGETRDISLDRDDVFLAIALENNLGGGLSLEDVADIDRTVFVEQDLDRGVDIDEDDAFLALALEENR